MARLSQQSLKIGLVIDTDLDKPDGVQQYVLAAGHWLSSQGHQVRYLAGQTKRTDLAGLYSLSRNISVSSNGNTMTIPLFAARRPLQTVLAKEKFDVLHVQTPYHPFLAGQLINLAPKRTAIVGTFHVMPSNKLLFFGNWLLGLWCYRSLKRFQTMLSVSPAAQKFCQQTFRLKSDVLPNFIDTKRFAQAEKLKQYQDDKINILFFGRLVPRKGALTLLQAVSRLPEATKTRIRLIICGSGPQESKLRHYAASHNLAGLTEFSGFVPEDLKPSYYASADIAVFPSKRGESFGIVLVEAMASGQSAVLAGNNPGYHYVLKDRPELLFNPDSPADLVAKLKTYIGAKQQRAAAAKWCQQRAQDFDVEAVGPKLIKVYSRALAKTRV